MMKKLLLTLGVTLGVGLGTLSAAAAVSHATRAMFGDGTYRVGRDIAPRTYRARGGDGCYWERLRNFSGGLNAILANENADGPTIVTISRTDRGFTTQGCGNWTSNLQRITRNTTRFGAGEYIVRTDIAPGTYGARGGEGCYWERLRSFTGSFNSIIANDNPTGRAIVTISATDRGFKSSGCGTWSRF
jgi:hypothetical protein